MKSKTILLSLITMIAMAFSVNAQEERKEPPTVDEIFKELDANEDDLLSEDEVKGPLKENFAKIDANEDGYLSKEEVENAKPKGRKPRQ
ncbi:EF-hand domain-containing protein [Neotamlana laminarinivorans]|uniref:EF-hand domain-containing protein n=1 Tax=Neotamlana laminarinivorans TaxID=2883124 RepID=A0A9X1L0M5_9FLAO|nr:EF-hand domain-containing protein [Tamlana laminarinivorans]MCB4797730.1 EF-hand domain-containing protein [Tamlana laminarinivorans]